MLIFKSFGLLKKTSEIKVSKLMLWGSEIQQHAKGKMLLVLLGYLRQKYP